MNNKKKQTVKMKSHRRRKNRRDYRDPERKEKNRWLNWRWNWKKEWVVCVRAYQRLRFWERKRSDGKGWNRSHNCNCCCVGVWKLL
jgi:hypothetical protein